MTFLIKRHDTRVPYVAQLKSSGTAIDLTLAATVRILMRLQSASDTTPPKVRAACSITSAVNGIVSYTWGTSDLDTLGDYYVEFEITWVDGGVQTVPNDGYNDLTVEEDLDTN